MEPVAARSARTYDVVVVGSANQDLALRVASIPQPGETVLALDHAVHAGGKGLNQAVAAARAGGTTAFVGAVGDDAPGAKLRSVLDDAGIDTARVHTSDRPTGVAVIAVDARGENSIIVAGGANATLELDGPDLDLVRRTRVLLLQLEVPLTAVAAAATAARSAGAQVILNAAPAQTLPHELLALVDVLVVNESEAETVAWTASESSSATASVIFRLLELVPSAIVTLGERGALIGVRGGPVITQAAPRTRAVDTTGAGDTFTGALAAAVARGDDLADAAWFGCCAASLAVEVPGAVPSIPRLAAIEARMRTTSRTDG